MSQSLHTRENLEEYLRGWMREQDLLNVDFTRSETLTEVGFDSLSIVDLARSLRHDLGIQVPLAELEDNATMSQTIELILRHAQVPAS